jgi:small-conductance mechanosensitive channel
MNFLQSARTADFQGVIMRQAKELDRLERAAEEADEPAQIQQTAAHAQPDKPKGRSKAWFVPYLIAIAVLGGVIFFLDWKQSLFRPSTAEKVHRYLVGALAIAIILGVARALEIYAIERVHNAVSRFNLKRILRFAAGLVALFVVVSVLFVNWYAAVVSLGLISLILGFALQTPISSFIGWVYILTRAPYRVGDRIEIGDARGDVIDVGYLDTTLWEIGGRHLSTDHPSGRLIKFPNTNVFSTPVFNYSWPLFPYIWNEIKFQIAYESDLEFVASTMQKIAENDLGPSMIEKVKVYRDLLARTPVGHLDVEERPVVLFRASENTWLEAIVRYLVHPKEAGRVKTRLTRKLLAALNSAPDRVLFPKSNLR